MSNYKTKLSQDLISKLRRAALNEAKTAELIVLITNELDREQKPYNSLSILLYFMASFCIDLRVARRMGAWHGFPYGRWSDEELDEAIMPYILANKSRWEHDPPIEEDTPL